eukprot:8362399-Pyramimonas_sp.AAC.1
MHLIRRAYNVLPNRDSRRHQGLRPGRKLGWERLTTHPLGKLLHQWGWERLTTHPLDKLLHQWGERTGGPRGERSGGRKPKSQRGRKSDSTRLRRTVAWNRKTVSLRRNVVRPNGPYAY